MQKIIQQIAIAGTLPDADLEFCASLQAAITQKLRGDAVATTQAQTGGAGATGGSPPMAPSAAGGPMPGLVPSAPNMDEIRRMVGASGQVQ